MTFLQELRRRNVFRVGIAYAAMAWVLLQIFDVVGDIFELPAWGGKLILAMLLVGFVLALVLAWAFEMTPEGIKRDKDVDRNRSVTAQTGRKLDRVIIGVLALAVVYLLVDKLLLEGLFEAPDTAPVATAAAPADESPSVAVLPFNNLSGDADNEYFSDGLTETLLHMLAQLPGLKVAARTSSFAFKGQSASIGEIAGALGVAHVLEGSVQKADDRVRVTAQLIRADDGFHVWSQNYTRPLEDIFAIQDEIAADVAEALGSSLLGQAQPDLHGVATTDLDAYDSYLKGLERQALYSYGALDEAEGHFQQALASDPGFVDARLALVRNFVLKFSTGLLGREEAQARTAAELGRVREQQPDSPLARALELTLQLQDFDPSRSIADVQGLVGELRGLLRALPTETFIRNTVARVFYFGMAETQPAIDMLLDGLAIDPLDAELHRSLGLIYVQEKRLDEARATLQRSQELAPDNPNTYGALASLAVQGDNLPVALDWMRQACEVDPKDHELPAQIARELYHLDLPEEGDYWLARVRALAPDSGLARSLEVERAVARGEPQQAIALAAAAIAGQFEDRQGAYSESAYHYVDTMLKLDRAREGYEFLASLRPEITRYETVMPDIQALALQWASIVLMSGFESFETRRAAWLQFADKLDAQGFPWKQDPTDEAFVMDYLMRGENEQAIEHYLQYEMTKPLARELERPSKPLYALYAPVYEDPRVAAQLAADAERYAVIRRDVIAMLHRPEWSP